MNMTECQETETLRADLLEAQQSTGLKATILLSATPAFVVASWKFLKRFREPQLVQTCRHDILYWYNHVRLYG